MTSSVKSRGCGDMNRIRSMPSTFPHSRSKAANAPRSPKSTPYALTFWPNNVISLTPCSASARTSRRISSLGRSFSRPRSCGTIQKVQVLLHPTEIDTQAENAEWRRAGKVEGKCSSPSRISSCASSSIRARSKSVGSEPTL